ncbi:MAG TPA: PAS domain S-box protein [Candidatus Acidoferrales bacterium]|nr:PAS domain S-box protein [Candidatus Acidoferrales bacterium]
MKRVRRTKSGRSKIHPHTVSRLLAESSVTGVFLVQHGVFRYVNETFAEMFGYEASDIVDKLGPLDLAAGDDGTRLSENINLCLKGESPDFRHSFHGITRDGKPVYAEIRGAFVKCKNHPTVIGTIADNTNHFKDDEALRETLNRYRSFFDEDIAPHYVTTPDGAFVDCNSAFARLFAFPSREEVLKANVSSLYPIPANRMKFIELIKERKQLKEHKTEYVRRDGKRMYVSENAVGEFDSVGNLNYVRGYLIDETSERQLEEELFQSQRLETLGTLVGGIAHDFNNILNVILSHVWIMERWRQDSERVRKSFEAVRKAIERGANTVKQLLTFARKVDVVTESVRIGDVVNEVTALLKETFPQKIVFHVEIEQDIPLIHADPNQLNQVLLNLCVNARDAMLNGGTISIVTKKIGREMLNERFRENETDRYLLLQIKDTGTGMDKETLKHIFEPFFTTKKGGQGTGLGLSVVYGIMKVHNGLIDVESMVGKGTTFSLYFPIPPQTIEVFRHEEKKGMEFLKGHGELILAIEDEEPLRDFFKTFLEDNGYKVLLAADGLNGLLTYKVHMNEVNLVILDMGLPEMGGTEVLSELKRLNPEVKVMLASGYLEPEVKADALEKGATDFLPKPYETDELLMKIYRTLGRLGV